MESSTSLDSQMRFDMGHPVAAQSDGIGEQVTPHLGGSGQGRQGPTKRLDGQVPVVLALLEPAEKAIPVNLPGSRYAAVVFRDVNVNRLAGTRGDRLGLALFFDVGVKAVVHHLAVGVVDGLDEPLRVHGRREEVDLESIQVFDRDLHSPSLSLLRRAR